MSDKSKAHAAALRQQRRRSKPGPMLWVVLALMGVAVVVMIASLSTQTGMGATPEFTATTLSGDTIQLSSYRGQVVMLNFWATWCPPCRAEMPGMETAYQQYRDQGFMVLAVNNGEAVQQISPFASTLGLSFPLVLDTDRRLQTAFAITGYPTSVFIGRDGKIFASHTGGLSLAQISQYVETGLAQSTGAA